MALQWKSMQDKWQQAWEDANVGKASAPKQTSADSPLKAKPKFFMIFAYPGVSGYLHVGHMRGFSYTDAICRLERMKGKEVLFPVGTHASGNHAFAFARKVKDKDQKWIDYLKRNGCDHETLQKLEDPYEVINYFNSVYVNDYWKKFGFLCDWDRFTTTVAPDYNRFIQWQFQKLKEKGMLIQKPYFAPFSEVSGPVAIDPSETDLSKGGNAEKNEYTLLKFKLSGEENVFLVAATLRPETIFGQTNLWINKDKMYSKVQVTNKNGQHEFWIMSAEAAQKIKFQKDDIKILEAVDPKKLLGKKALAPGIKREISVLPASFVNPDVGSGIVTSVPSDAPFDYTALNDLKTDQETRTTLQKLNPEILAAIDSIDLIPIIKCDGYGEYPAKEAVEKHQIKSLSDKEQLDIATKEVYKAGFHSGVMRDNCGKYAGQKVAQAKDAMKQDLLESSEADIFYDLSEEVICRMAGKVFIKRIDDQWFIDYGHQEVTGLSKEHAQNMKFFPEEYKENLPGILDWFGPRSCARLGSWMGTKLPWDEKWTIEPISDSTLYPLYYLVAPYIKNNKLTTEDLTDEFFDYVFLEKEPTTEAGKAQQESQQAVWDEVKAEAQFFLPLDINLGGKEHKTVHFPVYLMNHTAVLPQKYWPKGIFVNWWVTGKSSNKISKSKGGADPIPDAIEKYGVDAMRLYYAHIGSPHTDVAWDPEVVQGYKNQLEKIAQLFQDAAALNGAKNPVDAWLESEFNKTLKQINTNLETYNLRELATAAYYSVADQFRWYIRRGGQNKELIHCLLSKWVKLLAPLTPHIAEELNHLHSLSIDSEFVATALWPQVEEDKISDAAKASEDLIKLTMEGMRSVLKLAKIEQPKSYELFIARPWLYTAFQTIKDKMAETRNVGEVIKTALAHEDLKPFAKEVSRLVPSILKNPSKLPMVITSQDEEFEAMNAAARFLESEFACEITISRADQDPSVTQHPKANAAMPGKPGIVVE